METIIIGAWLFTVSTLFAIDIIQHEISHVINKSMKNSTECIIVLALSTFNLPLVQFFTTIPYLFNLKLLMYLNIT